MSSDLTTKRIQALSQWQTFLAVLTYKMAAKINWHGYGTKLRQCHPVYTFCDAITPHTCTETFMKKASQFWPP